MAMMDNKRGEREADEGLAALTMKFFFEVKPDEIDKGKTPGGGIRQWIYRIETIGGKKEGRKHIAATIKNYATIIKR